MRLILQEPPPGRKRHGAAVLLMLLFITGSALFRASTDVPRVEAPRELLPPPDDQESGPPDSPESNGWTRLRLRFEAYARAEEEDIRQGAPRVPGSAAGVRPGDVMTTYVEEALRGPVFRLRDSRPFPAWDRGRARLFEDCRRAMERGDSAGAARSVSAAARLGGLIQRECRTHDDHQRALILRAGAADWSFLILRAAPSARPAAAALAAAWNAEAWDREAAARALIRLTLANREGKPVRGGGAGSGILSFNKPNRTWRLLLMEAGRIRDEGLAAAPSLDESPGVRAIHRYTWPFPWIISMDTNREGLRKVMPAWAREYAAAEASTFRTGLFLTQAMRAALAAWLWRIDHGGTLPSTLAELAPDYLPESPHDPWTGGPLRWDPAGETISAAGPNWSQGAAPGPIQPGEIKTREMVPCVRLPYAPVFSGRGTSP